MCETDLFSVTSAGFTKETCFFREYLIKFSLFPHSHFKTLTLTHKPSVAALPCADQPCCDQPTSLWPSGSRAQSLFSDWPQMPPSYPAHAASDWWFVGAEREWRTPLPPNEKEKRLDPHHQWPTRIPDPGELAHLSRFQCLKLAPSVTTPTFLTSKSRYLATSTYPGRPSVSRKSRCCVMAIFPTPRLVLTEEDSLKTHSLGSMCSKTESGRHTWKSNKHESVLWKFDIDPSSTAASTRDT